jgi:hypothetical protein
MEASEMTLDKALLVGLAAFGLLLDRAAAADCDAVLAAMINTAKTPYASTTNVSGAAAQGTPMTVHIVQTPTAKYVDRAGKWFRLDISSQTLIDNLNEKAKAAKMNCASLGSQQLDGQSVNVYTAHDEQDGTVSDGKLYVSAQKRLAKVEATVDGRHSITTYDYDNVRVPASSEPAGQH